MNTCSDGQAPRAARRRTIGQTSWRRTVVALVAMIATAPALLVAMQPAQAAPSTALRPSVTHRAAGVNTTLDALFIPVFGTDQSAGSESTAAMQTAMTEADQYYNTVSRGALRINATVTAWRQVPMALADDCGHVELETTIATAIAAAQQAGLDPGSYDRVIVLSHQATSCTWGGGITTGSNLAVNHLVPYTIIHELGHTFGLGHVYSHDCDAVFVGSCTDVNYGGRFDPMGSTWPAALSFSGLDLEALGLLPANEVTTVSGNGTFTLAPLATAAPGAKRLLRIASPVPSGPTYTLEYRTPGGADAPMGTPAFADWRSGVILQGKPSAAPGEFTYQYDGTPGSQANDLADAGLPVGSSITDPGGLTITVTAQTPTSATVSVQGFLSLSTSPSIRSVAFTSTADTSAAKVRVAWANSWIASNVASVSVESSPQSGSPVTVGSTSSFADVPMPASPGCVRYRIRAVDAGGVPGTPSAWSTPRCFFDEVQPGSLSFKAALRPTSPAGAGTTTVASSVEPTWGQTNHFLPGAFDGYSYELTVPGQPLVTGTTSGSVNQVGFAPALFPVPVNTTRAASMALQPRPGDAITTEMHFPFNGSLSVPETTISEGQALHGATLPADPYASSTFVRRLTSEEVTATGCARAGAADVVLLPTTAATPFPEAIPVGLAATAPTGFGRGSIGISVRGNLTPHQGDRCLLLVDKVSGQPPTIRLIRIAEDDGIGPSSNGSA